MSEKETSIAEDSEAYYARKKAHEVLDQLCNQLGSHTLFKVLSDRSKPFDTLEDAEAEANIVQSPDDLRAAHHLELLVKTFGIQVFNGVCDFLYREREQIKLQSSPLDQLVREGLRPLLYRSTDADEQLYKHLPAGDTEAPFVRPKAEVYSRTSAPTPTPFEETEYRPGLLAFKSSPEELERGINETVDKGVIRGLCIALVKAIGAEQATKAVHGLLDAALAKNAEADAVLAEAYPEVAEGA